MSFCSCSEMMSRTIPFLSFPLTAFPTMLWLFADPGPLQPPSLGCFLWWFSLSCFERWDCVRSVSAVRQTSHVVKCAAFTTWGNQRLIGQQWWFFFVRSCQCNSILSRDKMSGSDSSAWYCTCQESKSVCHGLSFYFPHSFLLVENCVLNIGMLTVRQGMLELVEDLAAAMRCELAPAWASPCREIPVTQWALEW